MKAGSFGAAGFEPGRFTLRLRFTGFCGTMAAMLVETLSQDRDEVDDIGCIRRLALFLFAQVVSAFGDLRLDHIHQRFTVMVRGIFLRQSARVPA